ncbi:MAG: hypothetical protein ABSC33_11515 [Candidatus Sulfotelmatobacter sp.]|jgi:hypothetical protein
MADILRDRKQIDARHRPQEEVVRDPTKFVGDGSEGGETMQPVSSQRCRSWCNSLGGWIYTDACQAIPRTD